MSNLMKWSPFFDNFDSLEDFFKEGPSLTISKQGFIPPIDMYETENDVVIETPLPGVDANKISIEVEKGVLTIKGSSERKTEVDEKNYYRKEIKSGQIFRQINLPSHLEESKAQAKYHDGILKVQIPKSPEEKAKTIKIDVQ